MKQFANSIGKHKLRQAQKFIATMPFCDGQQLNISSANKAEDRNHTAAWLHLHNIHIYLVSSPNTF